MKGQTLIFGAGKNIERPIKTSETVDVFKLLGTRARQEDSIAASPGRVAIADGVGSSKGAGFASELAVMLWAENEVSVPALKIIDEIAEKITEKTDDAYTTFVGARQIGEGDEKEISFEMLSVGDSQGILVNPESGEVLYHTPLVNNLSELALGITHISHLRAEVFLNIFAALKDKIYSENGRSLPKEFTRDWESIRDVVLEYAHTASDQIGPGGAHKPVLWSGTCPVGTQAWLWTDGVSRVMSFYEIESILKKEGASRGFEIIFEQVKRRKEHFSSKPPEPYAHFLGKTKQGGEFFGDIGVMILNEWNYPKHFLQSAGDNASMVRMSFTFPAQK